MDYQIIISLLTLIALEVILGIDNVIFISILANKLPANQQKKARFYGLILAMVLRLGLLAMIAWVMKLDNDLFTLFNQGISVKDLILILGGLFLLYKSSTEIYHKMEGEQAGRIDYQTQGIAYSLDKGRTWTKYEKNPVLLNPVIRDFRDPKVSWNDVRNQWVMTLAVKDHIEFYGSPDLKKWSKLSEFGKTIGAKYMAKKAYM